MIICLLKRKSIFSKINYFDKIDVLNDYLLVPLIYPLKIILPKANEVNQEEKELIKEIFQIINLKQSRSFYMKDIISLDDFNIKKAENALNLIKKEIIIPLV